MTLEGIDGVEAFVEKLDRIEPPGQLVSFLTDPLLQKFVELKPSPIVSARIGLWLATCLQDHASAVARGTEDTVLLAELLNALLQHARYTKVCTVTRASHHTNIAADSVTHYTGIRERIYLSVEWSRPCRCSTRSACVCSRRLIRRYSCRISCSSRACTFKQRFTVIICRGCRPVFRLVATSHCSTFSARAQASPAGTQLACTAVFKRLGLAFRNNVDFLSPVAPRSNRA